jgi:FeoB-associated Cys-rich membrane protein
MFEIQLIAVWFIVAVAALLLLRQSLRTWLSKKGCGGGCGCSKGIAQASEQKSETVILVDQLTVRRR